MKPYWQSEKHGLRLFHGDCLEVMPELAAAGEEFDLCLTDPPYGLDFRGASWDAEIPDWLGLARAAAKVVVFTTGPTTQWDYPRSDWVLCWQRPASNSRSLLGGGFSHWTPVLVYGSFALAVDCVRLHAIAHAQPPDFPHPSPKPVALMGWLVENACAEGGTVIDPFLGSGTTLVACYRLGRSGVGIEIDESYCDLAVRRLEQEIAQGRLFEPAEIEAPKQEAMPL